MRWLDLFSGIGGFALGLRWAGFPPPVAFCEIDPFCQRVLRKHWPDVPIFDDVRELAADAIGPVELVTGGFPCQPWSVAGQQRGADDDRDLWPAMRKVVAACRPRWVLGENVSGFVSHPLGLDRILADLDALGYASQAFCIPACAVDAPHIRDRVWIVAHSTSVRCDRQLGGSEERSQRRAEPSTHSGSLAHALGARPQERAGEPGDDGAECEAAERGGGVGDAAGAGRATEQRSGPADSRWPAVAHRRAGSPSHWNNAEWLWCEFDQRWRRTQPGVRLLASGLPQRVARLRALGNAVVPQVVAEIGRAILVAEQKAA